MPDTDWPTGTYTLTMPTYAPRAPGMDHEYLLPGAQIISNLKPGPHMAAVDDAARDAKERAGKVSLDWTASIPLTGGNDDDLLAERVAKVVAITLAGMLPQLIGQPVPATAGKPAKPVTGTPIPTPTLPPPPPPPPGA